MQRAVLNYAGVIPLSPSQRTAAGGMFFLQTKRGAAVMTGFAIIGGIRWDDDYQTIYLVPL